MGRRRGADGQPGVGHHASGPPRRAGIVLDVPGGALGRRGRSIETRTEESHEGRAPGPVEGSRQILLQLETEAERILVHPGEQAGRGLLGSRLRGLPCLDPSAEQGSHEHAEAAAGIIDLVRLLVAAGKEGLLEANSSAGRLRNKRRDVVLDLLQVVPRRRSTRGLPRSGRGQAPPRSGPPRGPAGGPASSPPPPRVRPTAHRCTVVHRRRPNSSPARTALKPESSPR